MDLVSREEALSKGLTHYYTGSNCDRGHDSVKYVKTRACVQCVKDRATRFRKENPERRKEIVYKWDRDNQSKRTANEGKRRAGKLNATPDWLTPEQLEEIETIYEYARSLGYHVDHIVPLKHSKVCGLHVPWNLQALPPKENLVKHNTFIIEVEND